MVHSGMNGPVKYYLVGEEKKSPQARQSAVGCISPAQTTVNISVQNSVGRSEENASIVIPDSKLGESLIFSH